MKVYLVMDHLDLDVRFIGSSFQSADAWIDNKLSDLKKIDPTISKEYIAYVMEWELDTNNVRLIEENNK